MQGFDEYQEWTATKWTAEETPQDDLVAAAMGCGGEAGEFVDLVKKYRFHKKPLDREQAVKELGDLLFYVAVAAGCLGASLSEVASRNVTKLNARYPNGFNPEDAERRMDEQPFQIGDQVKVFSFSTSAWYGREGKVNSVFANGDVQVHASGFGYSIFPPSELIKIAAAPEQPAGHQ